MITSWKMSGKPPSWQEDYLQCSNARFKVSSPEILIMSSFNVRKKYISISLHLRMSKNVNEAVKCRK